MVVNDGLVVHQMYVGNGLNYESHIRRELERLIPTARVFWDIGSNAGLHTVSAKQLNPTLQVVCFEPSATNWECLVKTIALNAWPDVCVIPMAVSNACGQIGMNDCPDNPCCGAHGLHHQRFQPAITLDALALPLPDVVKMDVEGWELFVLQGASKLLAHKPVFITEFNLPILRRNATPEAYIDAFLAAGYKVTILDYLPGMRMQVHSGTEAVQHVERTSGEIADILVEPV